ncbi:MAG TPA: hypothetical protein VF883_03985 [Thermoanaerobaculia bacterium]
MTSCSTSSRTLVIDSRGPAGQDRARSRSEALQLLTAAEYDSLVLQTEIAGRDEYDLIAYLTATWPSFLQTITIRTVTPGRPSYQWNHGTAAFHVLPRSPRLRERAHRSQRAAAPTVASR